MDLKAAVEKYREVVKEFGQPMPLSRFGLPKEEVEAMVAGWDEDYHLHRHFVLLPAPQTGSGDPGAETAYSINGLSCAAIVFRESIRHAIE